MSFTLSKDDITLIKQTILFLEHTEEIYNDSEALLYVDNLTPHMKTQILGYECTEEDDIRREESKKELLQGVYLDMEKNIEYHIETLRQLLKFSKTNDLYGIQSRIEYILKYLEKKATHLNNIQNKDANLLASVSNLLQEKLGEIKVLYDIKIKKETRVISAASNHCADSAIKSILESLGKDGKSGSAGLSYSPKCPHDRNSYRGCSYTLENISDPECELAYILRRVKSGIEAKGYVVTSISYPPEDSWYSSIYVSVVNKYEYEAKQQKIKDNIEREKSYENECYESLVQAVQFFQRGPEQDFYTEKVAAQKRSLKKGIEFFKKHDKLIESAKQLLQSL